MDLRSGNFIGGGPEFALMHAAAAQLGRFYNLPVYVSSGLTDSKTPDEQSGYEKGLTGLAAALAGGNYIHHSAGFLESMMTVAYGQYVIDNDINGAIMRMVRGIEVTDETLSLKVIDQVCRGGKEHYLGTRQSLNLSFTEYFYPHIANRQRRGEWLKSGSPSIWDRARRKAKELLSMHKPTSIPAYIDDLIRKRFEIVLPPELTSVERQDS
jgi:trimethylamine--corrinoid protein Co-methyltransferase